MQIKIEKVDEKILEKYKKTIEDDYEKKEKESKAVVDDNKVVQTSFVKEQFIHPEMFIGSFNGNRSNVEISDPNPIDTRSIDDYKSSTSVTNSGYTEIKASNNSEDIKQEHVYAEVLKSNTDVISNTDIIKILNDDKSYDSFRTELIAEVERKFLMNERVGKGLKKIYYSIK